MKTKHSGARFSAIVGIGEKLTRLEEETGEKYLRLNRGLPSVTNIDLSEVIPLIDFNSPKVKVYPANSGLPELRSAINKYYFQEKTSDDNIFITAGGMNALDLVFKTLDVEKVYLPEFFWGAYGHIAKINKVESDSYLTFDEVRNNIEKYKGSGILICDPNNPIGDKYDDEMLLDFVEELNANDIAIIWDSPYRKIFFGEDDDFYAKLSKFENVIIVESFSKSVGLSGQRLGFVHTINKEFNTELNINILYVTNGINAFAQVLVEKILTSPEGQAAAKEFRRKTIEDMNKNIELLRNENLLAEEFYKESTPVGIFVVVNKSEDELLESKIGSVGLSFFTKVSKEYGQKYSRICIAVPHEEFKQYFKVYSEKMHYAF
ncbi:MAG: pyridoxal phosphate-dependent aminotransferase [Bacteroidota bacterium]